MLNTLVPKFLSIIADESDREVVMTAVDNIHDMLEKIGAPVLQVPNATDQILTKMKLIFTHQVSSVCQSWLGCGMVARSVIGIGDRS